MLFGGTKPQISEMTIILRYRKWLDMVLKKKDTINLGIGKKWRYIICRIYTCLSRFDGDDPTGVEWWFYCLLC